MASKEVIDFVKSVEKEIEKYDKNISVRSCDGSNMVYVRHKDSQRVFTYDCIEDSMSACILECNDFIQKEIFSDRIKRRRGKFYIDQEFVFSDLEFNIVMSKMGFRPLRVEFLMDRNRFEYIGLSHLFEEKKEYAETPEYNIIINRKVEDNGEVKISVMLEKVV